MDIASLGINIDASSALTAAQQLAQFHQATQYSANSTNSLIQSISQARPSLTEYAATTLALAGNLQQTTTAIDALVQRIDTLRTSMGGLSANSREIDMMVQRMDAFARQFGTTAAGFESFNRVARDFGMSATETVNALNRIQQALEGVTAEGRQARTMFEAAGINMNAMGRGDANQVLAQFVDRYRGNTSQYAARDLNMALGGLSVDTIGAITYADNMTAEQRRRQLMDRERAQQVATLSQQNMENQRLYDQRAARQADLENQFGGSWWFRPDIAVGEALRRPFESANTRSDRFEAYARAYADNPANAPRTNRQDWIRNSIFGDIGQTWDYIGSPLQQERSRAAQLEFGQDWNSPMSPGWAINRYIQNSLSAMFNRNSTVGQRRNVRYEDQPNPTDMAAYRSATNLFGDELGLNYSTATSLQSLNIQPGRPINAETLRGLAGAQNANDISLRRQLLETLSQDFKLSPDRMQRLRTMDLDQILSGEGMEGINVPREYLDAWGTRLRQGDSARVMGFMRQRGDAMSASDQANAGYGQSFETGERLRYIEQQRAEIANTIKDQGLRQIELNERILSYDRQIEDRKRAQTAQIRDMAGIASGTADAFMLSGNVATGLIAQAIGSESRQGDAAEQLNAGLQQSRLGSAQRYASTQTTLNAQRSIFANSGSMSSTQLQTATREMQIQTELQDQISRTEALRGTQYYPEALRRLQEMTDKLREQKQLSEEISNNLAGGQSQRILGAQRDIASGFGGLTANGSAQMQRSIQIVQQMRPSEFSGLTPQEAQARAMSLLNSDSGLRAQVNERLMADGNATGAMNAGATNNAVAQAWAGSIANPYLRAQEMLRIQMAGITATPGSQDYLNQQRILQAQFDAGMAGRYNSSVQDMLWSTADARSGYGWLTGGAMPGASPVVGPGVAVGNPVMSGATNQVAVGRLTDQTQQIRDVLQSAFPNLRFGDGFASSGHAPNSQHGMGRAFDFTARNLSNDEYERMMDMIFSNEGVFANVGAVGNYRNRSFHLDTRPGQRMIWGPDTHLSSARNTDPGFFERANAWRIGADPRSAEGMAANAATGAPTVISGGGGGVAGGALPGADILRQRLYGDIYYQAQQAAIQEGRSSGRGGPMDQAWIDQRVIQQATQQLERFTNATAQAVVSLDNMNRVNAASRESTYAGQRAQALNDPELERMRQNATALERTNPEMAAAMRQRISEMEGAKIGQLNAGLEGQFINMRRQTSSNLEDQRYQANNWWLSSSTMQANLSSMRAERELRDRMPFINADERQGYLNDVRASSELQEMNRQNQLLRDSFMQVGNAASSMLEQIIIRGGNARQVIAGLAASLASSFLRASTNKLFEKGMEWVGTQLFGGGSSGGSTSGISAMGPIASAHGNAFDNGFLVPMATGGIIDSPTTRPMAGGNTALMGEAGPEAVVPLVRTASGNLGVRSEGGKSSVFAPTVTINMNGGGNGGGGSSAEQAKMVADQVRKALKESHEESLRDQIRVGGMLNPVYGTFGQAR